MTSKNQVLFGKTRAEAIIPSKRNEDAGYDIYPCFEDDFIMIAPGETRKITTGLVSVFHESKVAILKERGSTGTRGIGQRCGIIDSGYRGEWLVPITNHNNDKTIIIIKKDYYSKFFYMWPTENFIVYPYEKAICQAIFFDVPKMDVKEASYKDIISIKSERGEGRLGSSGK